jgi:hypothetical protein
MCTYAAYSFSFLLSYFLQYHPYISTIITLYTFLKYDNILSILSDGLLGLCKLADVHHRLSRALTHDDAQIAQWLAFEQDRITACRAHVAEKEEHFLSLTNGYFPTVLSGPCHRPSEGLEESMGKLQREMTMRSQRLLEAEDEEDKAREVSISVFAIVVILLIYAVRRQLLPPFLLNCSAIPLYSFYYLIYALMFPLPLSHSPTPSSYHSLYP